MPYILECRINAREHVVRVSDGQGKELQKKQLDGSLPAVILVGELSLPTNTVQLIAPEHVWFENDRKVLSERGKHRCSVCFEVRMYGDECPCGKKSRLSQNAEPAYLQDVERLSPERMRAGWIRAIREAKLVAPKTYLSFCKGIMDKYIIAPEELEEAWER